MTSSREDAALNSIRSPGSSPAPCSRPAIRRVASSSCSARIQPRSRSNSVGADGVLAQTLTQADGRFAFAVRSRSSTRMPAGMCTSQARAVMATPLYARCATPRRAQAAAAAQRTLDLTRSVGRERCSPMRAVAHRPGQTWASGSVLRSKQPPGDIELPVRVSDMLGVERVLRSVYRAFNARDIETALELMHPDVDSPNAWEGGRVVGREA